MTDYVELDVRPLLAAGEEPFGHIMQAVAALEPGQGLRLLAPFRPVPLFSVMASKGFEHEAREIGGGDWQVLFRPIGAQGSVGAVPSGWPPAVMHLDSRGRSAPEVAERILAATEAMQPGEVMEALLDGEPESLCHELARRGHEWRGDFDGGGSSYRLILRIGRRD